MFTGSSGLIGVVQRRSGAPIADLLRNAAYRAESNEGRNNDMPKHRLLPLVQWGVNTSFS
jgi:hypothetical protein